jgi:hypothetical protein
MDKEKSRYGGVVDPGIRDEEEIILAPLICPALEDPGLTQVRD